ncbi:MAG: Na+-transporting NADH:ubiquinone oxidoreductase subunit D [Firmicutes bacterium HGW-Firmicutes-21]|nr:MAG: Na+-transporting NADH:ubiquinone oxidoreductase subunit D [Firmicutes bacterium HGW-Firmicutes-21]
MKKAPFLHTEKTYNTIMVDILIALSPVLVWSVFIFGARVLTIAALTVSFCIIFEFCSRYLLNKRRLESAIKHSTDLSSVVTGLLITFMLPVTVPLYLPIFTAFFAVVIAKQLFGGIGKNIFNPAVFAIAFIKILLPSFTSIFTKPFAYFNPLTAELDSSLIETVRVFSPLQMLGRGHVYEEGFSDLFYGTSAGNMGEVAVLILILGAIYLSYRKVIDIKGSLSFVATVFMLAFLFPVGDGETIYFAMTELMSGGVILLAVFACNDFTTTPRQSKGKVIFGVGCGILTVVIRYSFSHFEGVYVAILAMNLLTPLIDKLTRKTPYGMIKEKEPLTLKLLQKAHNRYKKR